MIRITLPLPPSGNTLYGNRKGGRYKVERYKACQEAAGWDIKKQSPDGIKGPYQITMLLDNSIRFNKDGSRSKVKRDLSNYFKGVSDLLVIHQIIEDDSLEESVHLHWAHGIEGCHVILEPVDD